MSFATLILALVIGIPLGILSLILLNRRKNKSASLQPWVEHEMTMTELNELIEERESAAKAPLVSRIDELEKRLQDREQSENPERAEREKTLEK